MSLQPPAPSKSKIGDVWVDPITADRFVFTGENLESVNYGWVTAGMTMEILTELRAVRTELAAVREESDLRLAAMGELADQVLALEEELAAVREGTDDAGA